MVNVNGLIQYLLPEQKFQCIALGPMGLKSENSNWRHTASHFWLLEWLTY